MSRIAGLVSFDQKDALGAACRGMLAAFACGRPVLTESGRAALGWSGRRGGGTGSHDGLAVAWDGHILNADELGGDAGPGAADDGARIAALYRRHGFVETMRRINAEAAVALYDGDRETLWLGRDRLGLKPLYYAEPKDGFAFASQPRALLALPGVSCEPNRKFVALFAASHYRTIDNALGESPYAEIAQLPAARVLEVRANGVKYHTYWRLAETPPLSESETALAERYRDLLEDSVRRRLAACSRPAFTLSGGLDSASVMSCAVAVSGERQNAFSSVYEDAVFDEREEIRDVVDEKAARWHAVEIGNEVELLDEIRRLVEYHDEPVVTATWLSHMHVCDAVAGQGFEALFGGLGGDELNAGEYEYFPFHFADLKASGDGARLASEIASWARHHDHPLYPKDAARAEALMARLTDPEKPGRCLPDVTRLARYHHILDKDYFDLAGFEPVMETPFTSYLANRTFQDLTRETAPCCLRAEDRQCGAAGLEHFDPFLDYRLVEFMFRVPGGMKIRDGVTKRLLREAMKGILPEATRARIKKTGWNAPAHRWFSGKTLDRVRDLVASRAFRDLGVFDVPAVRAVIDDHERIVAEDAVEENHMMCLWQIVNLATWLIFLKPPAAARR